MLDLFELDLLLGTRVLHKLLNGWKSDPSISFTNQVKNVRRYRIAEKKIRSHILLNKKVVNTRKEKYNV